MGFHYSIVHKAQVIAAAGLIKLSRLFAFHLLGTVVVYHRLIKLVGRSILREDRRTDDKRTTACRLIIGVRKI